jgi:hydrogenase-4 component E
VTTLLIGFIVVLLVPLFVATWRTSLFGLALQGGLLAAMAYRLEGAEWSAGSVLTYVDLLVVRGFVAPWLLYRVLHGRSAPERNDVLPPNMLAWAAAIGLAILALRVSSALVPVEGDEQMMVAAAASGVFLGFLVLATQVGVFSQIVGALRVENAVALFELSGGPHEGSVAVHLGQIAVLVASVLLFRWYLSHTSPSPTAATEPTVTDELEDLTR